MCICAAAQIVETVAVLSMDISVVQKHALVDAVSKLPKTAVIDCGQHKFFDRPWQEILVLGNGQITKSR